MAKEIFKPKETFYDFRFRHDKGEVGIDGVNEIIYAELLAAGIPTELIFIGDDKKECFAYLIFGNEANKQRFLLLERGDDHYHFYNIQFEDEVAALQLLSEADLLSDKEHICYIRKKATLKLFIAALIAKYGRPH